MLQICNCSKCRANLFIVGVFENYQYSLSVKPTRRLRILLPTVLVIAMQYSLGFSILRHREYVLQLTALSTDFSLGILNAIQAHHYAQLQPIFCFLSRYGNCQAHQFNPAFLKHQADKLCQCDFWIRWCL